MSSISDRDCDPDSYPDIEAPFRRGLWIGTAALDLTEWIRTKEAVFVFTLAGPARDLSSPR